MGLKVGINGFGRIGRNVFRAAQGRSEFEIVAVNDITSPATLAHLLKYDSILGNYGGTVSAAGDQLVEDGKPGKGFAARGPGALPLRDPGVRLVIETTGPLTGRTKALAH